MMWQFVENIRLYAQLKSLKNHKIYSTEIFAKTSTYLHLHPTALAYCVFCEHVDCFHIQKLPLKQLADLIITINQQ